MPIELSERYVAREQAGSPLRQALLAVADVPVRRGSHFRPGRLGRALTSSRLGPRYWWLWGATSVSSLGDGLALVGFPLLALTYTHDGLALSGLLVAQRLPWLFFSLPLGALADRADRRRMAITIEATRMVILGLFAAALFAGLGGLGLLYATAFALGALETGFFAAMSATVVEVVAQPDLATANGHLFAARTAGEEFVGPAVGGAMFAAVAALPFLLDGVSFAGSACLLMLVFPRRRVPGVTRPAESDGARRARSATSLWADVGSGLRYLFSHRLLRLLTVVVAGLAFCQAMVMGVLVAYGRTKLHLSPAGYGLFLGVGAVGNVTAGALAGRAQRRLGLTWMLIGSGLGAAGAYLLLGARAALVLAGVALFIECVCVGWGNVALLSLRQMAVPPELLGRTSSAFRMVAWGVIPIGALIGGLTVRLSSLQTAFVMAGLLQLVMVAATAGRLATLIRDAVVDLREPDVIITLPDDAAPASPTAAGPPPPNGHSTLEPATSSREPAR